MKNKILYLVVSALTLIPYLITAQYEPFMLDQTIIISPLEGISSLTELLQTYIKATNFDVQPIRDISHLIDINLSTESTKNIIPLVHNILLLFLTSFVLFKNLCLVGVSSKHTKLLITIFLFHPAIFHSFIEFTARKHILSFLFFQLSFYFYLKSYFQNKYDYSKSIIFYVFSLLSQPINALSFVTFFFFQKSIDYKKRIIQILPFAGLMILFFLINKYYYTLTSPSSKAGAAEMTLLKGLLPSAMYLRQFFLPYSFSTYYNFDSSFLTSLLIISPIFYYILYKFNKKIFIALTFPSLALYITLYGHKTNIYSDLYSNNYLLSFSFLLLMASSLFLKKIKHSFFPVLYLIPFILLAISSYYASLRTSKLDLYKKVVLTEPHCKLFQQILVTEIPKGNIKEILFYGNKWLGKNCLILSKNIGYQYGYIFTHLLLLDENLNSEEKFNLFKLKYQSSNDLIALKVILLIKDKASNKLINAELMRFKVQDGNSIFLERSYLINHIYDYCDINKRSPGCNHFKSYYEKVKDSEVIIKMKKL